MKEMNFDFGKDKVIGIEENKNNVVITLSKDMIHHVKFVFEECGIPGVVGPNIYINAKDVVEKYLEECKNNSYVSNAELKWKRKYKFAQKVSSLINGIYYEKDIEKKKKLVEDSLFICQKSRHNIRNHKEILGFIYDIKNTLEGYKGGFINPDAEYYYMTNIYPIFEKHGDEDFVHYLDQIR